MKIAAYVKSFDDKPLAPMHSYPRVKRFLDNGKAVIISHKPFVIKLTYEIKNPITQSEHLGVDTGRTNFGIVVIEDDGDIAYSAHVETCNKDVPKHMTERADHRHESRRGERKVRQRRAIANNTTFKYGDSRQRILPKCEEPITNNYITNSEAKYANRTRPEGWLTPTANHLLHTHLKAIEMVCDLLPVADITLEIPRWDFARMQNPGIKNWEYQKGKLFGFDSVDDAVYARQDGKCLICDCDHIDCYHHVVPRHLGGSESIDNRCGLCQECHDKVHKDADFKAKLKAKQEGLLKKFGALSVMNQIMPFLLKELVTRYPNKNIYVTSGFETAQLRNQLGLPKTHVVDAWCIAASRIDIDNIAPSIVTNVAKLQPYEIKQFRRQNRAIVNNQRERTYKYNGQIVAKNRHKRIEQEMDSLEEWYAKQVALYGIKKAEKMRSQLKVTKSTRYYNTKGRIMPGAVFLYNGKRCVLSGQHNKGAYLRAVGCNKKDFSESKCTIIQRNSGLVYL
jgi:hypothetical protein